MPISIVVLIELGPTNVASIHTQPLVRYWIHI